MSIDRRLRNLLANLATQQQEDAALTAQQMEQQIAQMVQFMGSGLFNPDSDVIPEPTGPHTGENCPRCRDIHRQAVTVNLTACIESGDSSQHQPISEREWRSRGRWWPDTADIRCLPDIQWAPFG